MASQKTARWNEKKDAIADAGAKILNRTGLTGLNLADVAAEVGLKRPSLVYYFGNVDDLAAEIYARSLSQLEERVEVALKENTPRDGLARLFEIELEYYEKERLGEWVRRPHLGEVRALPLDHRRTLGAQYHQLLKRVAQLVGSADRPGRLINSLGPAHLVMENIFWLPAWVESYDSWNFPHVRDSIVDVLLKGFVTKTGSYDSSEVGEPLAEAGTDVGQSDYLETATRFICEFGIRGAAIDRISAELGVTKGSFYHHLDSKLELIEACFDHSQERMSEIQRRATFRDLPPAQRLSSVLSSIVRIQLEGRFPLLRTSALPALSFEKRAQIINQHRRSFRWFAAAVSEGLSDGTTRSPNPHITAQFIGVTANSMFDLSRLYRGHIGLEDKDSVLTLIHEGIEGFLAKK